MILHGDCRLVLPTLAADSVDACITDPPYELAFMGKAWDRSGVAFDPATWAAVFRVLKPGAHLLAFGGTRTYHRMVCAIEDAGFEIRDQLQWLYGQGFPKSLNVGEGRGTGLKPAHEPIVLARKPLTGTVAANVWQHGTGALNINGCRIGTSERPLIDSPPKNRCDGGHFRTQGGFQVGTTNLGRWPSNVLLDESAAAALDEQSGELVSGGDPSRRHQFDSGKTFRQFSGQTVEAPRGPSSGGASRFFYVAKPSKSERGEGNTHPTVKPVALLRYLVRLVTPPGGTVLDPFMGSGTTLLACEGEGFGAVGIELSSEYIAIAKGRLARVQPTLDLVGS